MVSGCTKRFKFLGYTLNKKETESEAYNPPAFVESGLTRPKIDTQFNRVDQFIEDLKTSSINRQKLEFETYMS